MAEIKTRISLKYDSLTNWQSSVFNGNDSSKYLKAGEVAIVTLAPNKETNSTATANQHPLLFKVGTGAHKFDDLPWASALAADVYDWAKKSESDFITWVNTIVNHPAAPDLTPYLVKDDIAEGATNGTIAVRGEDVKVHGLGSAAYTDATAYATAAQGQKADAAAVKADVDSALALKADKSVVEAMYTNAKINELVQGAKDYADTNDADTKYGITYDSDNKKIKLVEGGSEVEIDATAFIKDGMIETVTIGADNDLIITFNTAAGKENIVLPLDQLVDIYTGVEGTKVAVSISADKQISANIVAGSIAKTDLAADVQTSLGLADSALQSEDIADLASKTDVIVALAEAEGYADTLNTAMADRMTEVEGKVDALVDEDGAKALAQEAKDLITTNKLIWDNAGTALQPNDLDGYAQTTEVTKAIEDAIADEVTRANEAYAPKETTAQGIENASAAAEAAQGTANDAKSLAEAALPKATAEADYLKKTDAASTYRAKADKITPADLSEEIWIFNCGSATVNIAG